MHAYKPKYVVSRFHFNLPRDMYAKFAYSATLSNDIFLLHTSDPRYKT